MSFGMAGSTESGNTNVAQAQGSVLSETGVSVAAAFCLIVILRSRVVLTTVFWARVTTGEGIVQ